MSNTEIPSTVRSMSCEEGGSVEEKSWQTPQHSVTDYTRRQKRERLWPAPRWGVSGGVGVVPSLRWGLGKRAAPDPSWGHGESELPRSVQSRCPGGSGGFGSKT